MRPVETIQQRNERLFGIARPVAFVSGSIARVGRCVAETLLREEFRVVFHAHRETSLSAQLPSLLQANSQEGFLVTGGVEIEDNVAGWKQQILERYGRIDVLVNSAAIWSPKPLELTLAKDFSRFFEVNALGSALTCKHFGLAMVEQAAGGAIINIGDWAVRRPYRDFAAYFLSKGAIESLTACMAVELATRNPRVRVNGLLPGPVLLAEQIGDAERDKITAEALLQRQGNAEDVAQAVLFLATSPFVSGVCIPIDGGRTIYSGPSTDPLAHAATPPV